jgi:MFS family permease
VTTSVYGRIQELTQHWCIDFHNPQGSLKGIIAAAYSLGAILSLPFIPMVDNRVGRRGSILVGSTIMVIGAIIQGFSTNVTMYIFARLM